MKKLSKKFKKMGFNKMFVPSINIVSAEVYDYGVEWVVQKYGKADALMGDSESVDYINRLIRMKNENELR
jgi:hypothetical protein